MMLFLQVYLRLLFPTFKKQFGSSFTSSGVTYFALQAVEMVITPEQDAYILMAHYRSGTRNDDGTWSYSLQFCYAQFMEAFPGVNIGFNVFRHHKYVIVKQFEDKNCICKGKSTGRPTVLTQTVVENLQERIEQRPKKPVSKLSGQTGLSVGTYHKALKKVCIPTKFQLEEFFPGQTISRQLWPPCSRLDSIRFSLLWADQK